jgi:hypothetical protein
MSSVANVTANAEKDSIARAVRDTSAKLDIINTLCLLALPLKGESFPPVAPRGGQCAPQTAVACPAASQLPTRFPLPAARTFYPPPPFAPCYACRPVRPQGLPCQAPRGALLPACRASRVTLGGKTLRSFLSHILALAMIGPSPRVLPCDVSEDRPVLKCPDLP